jgi:hypothetical protein
VDAINAAAAAERPFDKANDHDPTFRLLSRISFAASGVLLLAGGWLLWSGSAPPATELALGVSPTGLTVSGRF